MQLYANNTCSGRGPAASGSKKHKSEEEADDLTKEMEEPPPEPNIQEVTVPKPGTFILYLTVLTLEATGFSFSHLRVMPKVYLRHLNNTFHFLRKIIC